jgi:hypothetical protein
MADKMGRPYSHEVCHIAQCAMRHVLATNVRLTCRVINLIKKWLENFFFNFDLSSTTLVELESFISTIVLPRYTAWGQMILGMIIEKVCRRASKQADLVLWIGPIIAWVPCSNMNKRNKSA